MAVEISVIKAGGEEVFLNLFPDTQAQFQQFSPVFKYNSYPAAYSFGIEFPAEGNDLTLGFQTSPFVSDKPVFLESRFYHNGSIKYRGKLLVERDRSSREKTTIEASFIVNGWASLIEGVSIREVCDEIITLGSNQSAIAAAAKTASQNTYPTSKVYFSPFKNESHYTVSDGYSGTEFNSYDQAAQEFRFNTDGTTSYGLAPSVYMLEVLRQCFEYFGYTVSGNVFDDARFKTVLVDGLTSLDDVGTLGSAFLSLSSDVYYDLIGSGVPPDPTLPVWDTVEEDFTITGVNLAADRWFPLPELPGSYTFDFVFVFGDVDGDVRVVLDHPEFSGSPQTIYTGTGNETISWSITLDFTTTTWTEIGFTIDFDGGFGTGTIKAGSTVRAYPAIEDFAGANRWLSEFRLGDCLPDVPVSDFIRDIRKMGINVFFDDLERTAIFKTVPEILSEKAVPITDVSEDREREIQEERRVNLNWKSSKVNRSDLRDLGSFETVDDLPPPAPGRLAHVVQTNNYYVPTLPTGETQWEWKILGQKIDGISIGNGREENITLSAGLAPVDIFEMDSEEVLARSYNETGGSTWQEQGLGDYALRFSIAHGFQSGSVGLYPEQTPYDLNYSGSSVAPLSLLFERETIGLYELFWRGFLSKLYGSSKTTSIFLLKTGAGKLLRSKLIYENVEYLLEKITPEFGPENQIKTAIELRKINLA